MKSKLVVQLEYGQVLYATFFIYQTSPVLWRVKKHYQRSASCRGRINMNFKSPGEALYTALSLEGEGALHAVMANEVLM